MMTMGMAATPTETQGRFGAHILLRYGKGLKKMKSINFLVLALLTGCATSTGVVPIGQDTFMISGSGKSPGGYSGSEVKAASYREASQYCTSLGKKLQVVNTRQNDQSFGVNATAELTFMCLDATDAELSRPKLRNEANQVIEVRKDIKLKDQTSKSKDFYDELVKLDDLRKRGIINAAEFDDQKKRLLGGK